MKVALVWHGDREARDNTRLDEHRLGPTAAALRQEGMHPEAAVYNDDFADEVREQLLRVDAVLVWVNPIEQGRDRTKLDAMLKDVAESGVLVSAHPNTIQKMGTKQVLYDTRNMEWGSDVHVYRTFDEIKREFPIRMIERRPRVLKQCRGHSGQGVWKLAPTENPEEVLVRHAARGSVEQTVPLAEFLETCKQYFDGEGRIIDQAYQDRLKDGTIRCYLVQDRIEGFGHQEINALYPAPPGASLDETPQPGPRLYYPPTHSEFQKLKEKVESRWIAEMMSQLDLGADELPLLWDIDFMLGPKDDSGNDTHVLCEMNVSSVYPYPESAMLPLARSLLERIEARNA